VVETESGDLANWLVAFREGLSLLSFWKNLVAWYGFITWNGCEARQALQPRANGHYCM
jgi:hypothetical protein